MSLTARPTPAFNSCRQQKLSLDVRQPHAVAYRSFVPRYQRGSLHIACTAKPKATEGRLVRKVCLPIEAYVCTALAGFGMFGTSVALVSFQAPASDPTPFFEPLLRSFVLGLGTGALFEFTHVSWKVRSFAPLPSLSELQSLRLCFCA